MTQFITTTSAPFGTVPQVPNEFAGGGLHTTILIDPIKIGAFKDSIADQMNKQSGGPTFKDLSDRIQNVQIQTSAQGSGILTVSLIDPMWTLLISGFIQADAEGFLWPPIDINFPTHTDMVWRLAQVTAHWEADPDTTQGNVTLVFEDRIVSLLREMSPAIPGGKSQGDPNQTLGQFFKMLVDNANSVLHLKKGERIRFLPLISPQDPNATVQVNDIPAGAENSLQGQPVRKNPLKNQFGLTNHQQQQLEAIQQSVSQLFGITPGNLEGPTGGPLTIAQIEQGAQELFRSTGTYHVIGYGPVGNPIIGGPAQVP